MTNKLLRQRWIAVVLFLLGSLHILIIQKTYKPNSYAQRKALVLDEFNDAPPTQIIIWGERESGVDLTVEALQHAFVEIQVSRHTDIFRTSLVNDDELETIAARTDILWIIPVRSPCEWAEAMMQRKKEWCVQNRMLHDSGLHFCEEIDHYNSQWEDWEAESSGEVIIPSETKRTNFSYKNIFDMRRQNLLIMQQIMELVPRHVKIVRLGEFELNPNALVKDLEKEYKFTLARDYKPLQIPAAPTSSLCLNDSKWKDAQKLIDWKLEGYFGHHSLECHLCYEDVKGMNSENDGTEAPSIIYVLGERNSGTTFVSDTLAEAFDPPNSMGSNLEKFSSGIPVLLHKHMFRHDLLNESELAEVKERRDIVWILVVRSPCDWAEGMYRKPYHLCPPKFPEKCGPASDPNQKIWMNQNNVAGVKLLDFFTTFPWVDWAESVPFLRSSTNKEGDPEVSISKPSLNYTYPNVFALRKHKLKIMKQIIEAVPRNVKLVRLKEIERSPEKFIQDLSREFKMSIKEGYKPQTPSIVTHSTVCMTSMEWEAAEEEIDWELDGEFGFSPFDCRMCYGYDKSTRLYDRVMESNKVRKILKESAHQTKRKKTKAQKE
ncbi:hypothetical protein ACHAW6_016164 [Cyclotella cf. meneghiniana]